ncbi:uncharacterized protein LOC120492981 isoform X2 [Pimephales promelas]|uniref:uncharacterized protein LOC120492981 isoform X2 n=1 Tax=Pimephales promelas TaxID=90988 RepID=UPI00195579CA|nr:uncharacterized protein LOC120492981 isoform X2 [Pimephales promelas]
MRSSEKSAKLLKQTENTTLRTANCNAGRAALCVSLNLNVQKVKNMNSRLLPLILLLLHNTGSLTLDSLSVTRKDVCAPSKSPVELICSYSKIKIKTVLWFSQKQSTNWRKNDEPEDLTLDSDYSGRVKQEVLNGRSTLTISDLRGRDSGEYQLMFIMKDGVKRLSSVAANLTVTDLQVRMNPATTDPRDQSIKLTCDSSCTTDGHHYWMKDGKYLRHTSSNNILVSPSTEAGRYSCGLDFNLKHHSSSVCISKSGCWDVSYSSRSVCALMGSTVDISSTYSHPSGYILNKTFWHYVQPGDFNDLREEHQFAGRVEYEGNTLRIKELKMSDSGEYRFRIITDTAEGKYSGSPGVMLTVTDTTVISSPNIISEGQEVILSCSTKCTLNINHTYIWYKNGWQVTDGFTKANKLYLDSVSNEDLQEYSCAVEGRAALCVSLNLNVQKVKNMNSRLLSLILLLLHNTGFVTLDLLSVSCDQENICSVKEFQKTLSCHFSHINIKTVFWFSQKQSTNWRKNDEPEDLTLDSDYSGRVKQEVLYDRSTLTISDLRERDSGEYQLMFIMKDGVKRLSSVAVNLTVTDLQVRMNPATTDPRDQSIKLTCDSSCTTHGYYSWMKDGKYLKYTWSNNILVSPSTEAGRYSCGLDFNLKHHSSSVCISKSGCWDVSYSSRSVCALMGSTVDISSTYSHPSGYILNKTFWHYVQPGDFNDLREEHQFAGRVEYEGNTLRIKELKMSDSGEYRFRIITDTAEGKYSGSPGVMLTVTDTTVISSPNIISEGQEVILSCSTKCTLNNKHTYSWYKNGRQVTDGFTKANKLYLDSVINEDLKEYSCAVEDRKESTALRNTVVVLCGFLTLTFIGVLCYRRRRCALSKTHKVEKEEVLYDSVHDNAASSDLMQKADADNQDIQYSSISFKTKDASSIPAALYETYTRETEDVHYSTVMFK